VLVLVVVLVVVVVLVLVVVLVVLVLVVVLVVEFREPSINMLNESFHCQRESLSLRSTCVFVCLVLISTILGD